MCRDAWMHRTLYVFLFCLQTCVSCDFVYTLTIIISPGSYATHIRTRSLSFYFTPRIMGPSVDCLCRDGTGHISWSAHKTSWNSWTQLAKPKVQGHSPAGLFYTNALFLRARIRPHLISDFHIIILFFPFVFFFLCKRPCMLLECWRTLISHINTSTVDRITKRTSFSHYTSLREIKQLFTERGNAIFKLPRLCVHAHSEIKPVYVYLCSSVVRYFFAASVIVKN